MIRQPRNGDQAYVCSTWMRSARLDPTVINRVLDHPSTRVLIDCADADQDRVRGWIAWGEIARARVLHYVYVRDGKILRERGHGLGRELVKRAGFDTSRSIVYTCSGPDGPSLLRKYSGVHLPVEELIREIPAIGR